MFYSIRTNDDLLLFDDCLVVLYNVFVKFNLIKNVLYNYNVTFVIFL